MKRDCAFQYFDGIKMRVDKTNLTLEEAKQLWYDNYQDMVDHTKNGDNIEVAIWDNMRNENDYSTTFIHLASPYEERGVLWEKKFYHSKL